MKIEHEIEQTKNRKVNLEWNQEQREIAIMQGMILVEGFKELINENFDNYYGEENRF